MRRLPLTNLFPKGSFGHWSDIAPLFGNTFYSLDSQKIQRGETFASSLNTVTHLPALLHPTHVVTGELIPSTSWGASLSNLLTKKSWDGLRHPLIEKNHQVCELCGVKSNPMDVHEVWSYEFPSSLEVRQAEESNQSLFCDQVLDGFLTVCQACHACFHLGFAKVKGRLPQVLNRLAKLNQWNAQTLDQYTQEVFHRFKLASGFNWMLDFKNLQHPEGGLTIKKEWNFYQEGSPILTLDGKYGTQYTAVANIPWRFSDEKEWRINSN